MKDFKLTVFTEPIAATGRLSRIKSWGRPLKHFLQGKPRPRKKQYGGHYAVTRSLIDGLKKADIHFNYNPSSEKDIADHVVVLSGIERLKQMIALKRTGKIRQLLAGPNVVEDVREEDALVANPAIDRYIVPSEWVYELAIEDCADLKNRVSCWAAGVDTDYWNPEIPKDERKQALIYWKSEPQSFYAEVAKTITELGYTSNTVKYGDYTINQYRSLLDKSKFMVFISRSESQGIALAEAWSMDVPTLVFDPKEFLFGDRVLHNVSSSPYLSTTAGATWKELGQLSALIRDKKMFDGFAPRKYALEQFTDEYCARKLIRLFNNN